MEVIEVRKKREGCNDQDDNDEDEDERESEEVEGVSQQQVPEEAGMNDRGSNRGNENDNDNKDNRNEGEEIWEECGRYEGEEEIDERRVRVVVRFRWLCLTTGKIYDGKRKKGRYISIEERKKRGAKLERTMRIAGKVMEELWECEEREAMGMEEQEEWEEVEEDLEWGIRDR